MDERFKIKPILVTDENYVLDVIKKNDKCFKYDNELFMANKMYKVVDEYDVIIAFFGLAPYTYESTCICYLWVDEHYRKQGIATAILDFCKEETKDCGYVYLLVEKDNEEAINFYKKRFNFLHRGCKSGIPYKPENLDKLYINNNRYEVLVKLEADYGR